MDKKYIDFACNMHGYLIRVKEIHWNTNNNSEHLLCDEIESAIHDCEDRFMEVAMGMEGEHFPIGKLLPMIPNATSLSGMLNSLDKDVVEMLEKCKDKDDEGLRNALGDLHECCKKYKYRATQK